MRIDNLGVANVLLMVACSVLPIVGLADDAAIQFFEKEVRPVLVEKCGRCHGGKKQSGGLRLDSRAAMIEGGESSAAIVPGDVANSLLVSAIRRDGDLEMPPDEKLSDREIHALEQWIKLGAPWPKGKDSHFATQKDAAREHWAFQPVKRPAIPNVKRADWIRTFVDAFVMEKLLENNLAPSPRADRRKLIRRVTYSLTGLPPSPEEVRRFVNNSDPQAYERLVERLLESPHYGEQWARHWLDVARYSDTKGYVYAREERHWVHAWTYRDWVVRSLNADMPYDRFLLLQLAADQAEDRNKLDLAAMGFLTLGRRFLGVQRDIIDDRIDVVCRGTMGLTVSCARCHDHKYDPIPSADYYSLYGVFNSCLEQLAPLESSLGDEAYQKELHKRQEALNTKLKSHADESSARARERVADYLFAQSELHKYPANGFDQIFQKEDLLPAFVRRWERYLRDAKRRSDPIFVAWHAYAAIPPEDFAHQAAAVTNRLHGLPSETLHPNVALAFAQPPVSFREVCDRYGKVFAAAMDDPKAEALRKVLFGPDAPCQVPDGPISHTETFFDSAGCTELWKLQGEVDRWIINSKVEAPYALALIDQATPVEPRIFRRGNPLRLGDDVPRQFLSVLAGDKSEPFKNGSGRLELAHAIIDPQNPLTARVIVNRVWTHHFGHGLVSTPSDFGTRAAPPSHPELLDWLAFEFVAEGWSLKKLHRWIVLSATFCQSSSGPTDLDARALAMQIDPDNRLLSRMNARRLTFEEFRDSLLSATNELDRSVGGKPTKLFDQPYPKRRTIYGKVDRQYLPGTLRVFDFANPDLHVPKRSETIVPQQALFFLNHPQVLERAKALTKLAGKNDDPRKTVAELFQWAFQRNPTAIELADALALVAAAETKSEALPPATATDWQYGFGTFDETANSVTGFTPLPHFTGNAWQGGPKWPDAKLGWVQLTADGGHPGNNRQHAAIRRWTAPRDMTIKIQSQLKHEPTQGDGIRAFVVSSKNGLLQFVKVHHDTSMLNAESIAVSKGETIDFVVDIGDILNSDQYLWQATIEDTTKSDSPTAWNSTTDFPRTSVNKLSAWEQLAQVLLCTNEFMFVD